MNEKDQNGPRKVVFRRIGGRIVPISVGAVGVSGAVAAADAARTHTVYAKKGVTMVRKKFSLLPQSVLAGRPSLGTKISAFNRQGSKVGHTFFSVDKNDAEGSFDWLSVRKKYRGKGFSKDMAKQAAVEMKSEGAKTISSHVVHKNSAALFEGSKVKSVYTVEGGMDKNGLYNYNKISEKSAHRRIAKYQDWYKSDPDLVVDPTGWLKAKFSRKPKMREPGAVFRDVTIPKGLRRSVKPFRTTKNKVTMALGAAAAIGSLGYFAFRKEK